MSVERERLEEEREKKKHWRRWGPYLSERQWGTVREDDSENDDVWEAFTHEHSRSRAYRWGEDGIAGISDNHQRLCFSFAFWNGEDPILKERLFGLTNLEGNHGEDVKEYYFYVDNTPTHSYMRYLYKYPHCAFPYTQIVQENQKRGLNDPEYELIDTGIFEGNRYFDIILEYAKVSPDDLLVQITIVNRGAEAKKIHLLPTLWFRNTWSFGKNEKKPLLKKNDQMVASEHPSLGKHFLYFEEPLEVLFTENETNLQKVYGIPNRTPYVKDAFHEYLIHGVKTAVNPSLTGTKCAVHYERLIGPGESQTVRLRLSDNPELKNPFSDFDKLFSQRREEADQFYNSLALPNLSPELRAIQRQAFAGMLWNKQFYHYVIEEWLKQKPRQFKRNADWIHLYNDDILSVPDKWEYPAFFSWDTAFQTLPLAMIDPEFAKRQLTLLTREWYMHPSGQIPAYEWSFSDVNPPVHAWAAWRIYKIEKKIYGREDRIFLERTFQKLLLNFTWWVNRKDAKGKNVFQGGFLGLDNISIFNRSDILPPGTELYQSDATSWMGMYCLNMLTIALELSKEEPSYEDMASKFFEHFLYIAEAVNYPRETTYPLWDEEDGFYYDVLQKPDGSYFPLKLRSMVGIIPLFAITTLSPEDLELFGDFRKRMEWFLDHRKDLCGKAACFRTSGMGNRKLLSIVSPERLKRLLQKILDENEFLSPYGIRSLSKYHQAHPYTLRLDDHEYTVYYEPSDSYSKLFGGNSNWRGPIWFPLNMLIIESLQKFHHYLGDDFKVECPTGSGKYMNLWEVAGEISKRLMRIFTVGDKGERPLYGGSAIFQKDPHWKDFILFYEYFHGDNGAGIGASHQTGWTGLIAKLIQQSGQYG